MSGAHRYPDCALTDRDLCGDPADVDRCLERWISDGAVTCEVDRKRRLRRAKKLAPGEIDEDLIDESIDLDVDRQRRILEFEAGLGRPDHEVLGISPDSDVKLVKRAYFALSKEFHPDRYFRREIGEYNERLQQSELPKLLLYANPGALLTKPMVEWCKGSLKNLTAVDVGRGSHFIQEDVPDAIGRALAEWYQGL